ncbi:hypothetical protein DSM106972_098770 [Dulcicalothrix desertica PCC 7102]|uniref:Uncharacterized protein n=1 Tax=Dulcicalothrix desertica PCC 7102 TaxID=232991 RepID=A0A3S5K2M7_9CYAN|nr:hypothetical protein [Dulcicalothrix desertica]RUS92544.1 hypothetical protein DSM106972_098770 [Dulcicalothrix desertica PCC 7102]TWH62691.1 hypothetical protein CAL7102_00200 [Dulcicalothrix desertica PCC 7102]
MGRKTPVSTEDANVAIWLGNFVSQQEYEEYLEDNSENYASQNTLLSVQLSRFALLY